jgi:hypothetical protein
MKSEAILIIIKVLLIFLHNLKWLKAVEELVVAEGKERQKAMTATVFLEGQNSLNKAKL